MTRHIRTKTHAEWVRLLFANGFQAGVDAAFAGEAPFERAYRFVARLEDSGVIQQFYIDLDEHGYIDVFAPTGAPLYVAGPKWDELVTEAVDRGILRSRPRERHGRGP